MHTKDKKTDTLKISVCVFMLLGLIIFCRASFAKTAELAEGSDQIDLRRLFVLANLEFTLFHEFGHALIDELHLPVFGMEEDAADRIAIVAMLKQREGKPEKEIIPWLFAVAGDWYTEWELSQSQQSKPSYWDNHRLEIQRFHSVVCLVYGSGLKSLEELIDTDFLPFERAMNCDYEYRQAREAVEWALATHGNRGGEKPAVAKVSVVYEQPSNPGNQRMLEWVRASAVADRLASRFSANFNLPRAIRIDLENCGSSPDAYWHPPTGTITVCYELLTHFLKMADHRLRNPGRACDIPTLRTYIADDSRCPTTGSDVMPKQETDPAVESGTRPDG